MASDTKQPPNYYYETDPLAIEKASFEKIRELSDLSAFDKRQQQVVMRMVHSLGMPHIAEQVRFSADACGAGMRALAANSNILCDVEMVKQGITKRMINKAPLCFLNEASTIHYAKTRGQTRSMAALHRWREHLAGAVVVIGNAPTALFRLLEMLAQGVDKPALIIGMPVGFVGAAESKRALWDNHQTLGVECITLLGREGGSAVSCASCNALLRCNLGEYY
ncbi:MAG: precorrin-8X methylmutase [Cellvibrionaceae bacterium]|nr:precorrin-8X methylmutase [Cellvibrionaceae bacterium]